VSVSFYEYKLPNVSSLILSDSMLYNDRATRILLEISVGDSKRQPVMLCRNVGHLLWTSWVFSRLKAEYLKLKFD
jgi:hypothetical protein